MKTAMILSAGRGERLKPLTDSIPKPLCQVRGKPLIEHHIINLAKAGIQRVVINHAYLGDKIRQYLGCGQRFGVEICYLPEPPGALETGGGIVNALPLLGQEPFITVNADIFSDFNFKHLVHTESPIHLILVDKDPTQQGDFGLDKDDRVINENKQYLFSGIASYHPQVFTPLRYGRYSVAPLLRKYADEKQITAQVHQGIWFDVGTLARFYAANQESL